MARISRHEETEIEAAKVAAAEVKTLMQLRQSQSLGDTGECLADSFAAIFAGVKSSRDTLARVKRKTLLQQSVRYIGCCPAGSRTWPCFSRFSSRSCHITIWVEMDHKKYPYERN